MVFRSKKQKHSRTPQHTYTSLDSGHGPGPRTVPKHTSTSQSPPTPATHSFVNSFFTELATIQNPTGDMPHTSSQAGAEPGGGSNNTKLHF